MKKQHWVGLVAVAVVVGMTVLRSQAYFQEAPPLETLPKELGKATELKEEDVVKVLAELGPELAKQIASGRTVTIHLSRGNRRLVAKLRHLSATAWVTPRGGKAARAGHLMLLPPKR